MDRIENMEEMSVTAEEAAKVAEPVDDAVESLSAEFERLTAASAEPETDDSFFDEGDEEAFNTAAFREIQEDIEKAETIEAEAEETVAEKAEAEDEAEAAEPENEEVLNAEAEAEEAESAEPLNEEKELVLEAAKTAAAASTTELVKESQQASAITAESWTDAEHLARDPWNQPVNQPEPSEEEADEWEEIPVPPEKGGSKKMIGAIIAVIVIAALCGGYAFLCHKGETRSIDTQYYVNNVNITGLTAEQAQKVIQDKFEADYADAEYKVQVDENSYNIPIASYLAIDATKEIDIALSDDPGPWIGRGLKYIQSKINSVEVEELAVKPFLEDEEGLRKAVKKVSESAYEAPQDTVWSEQNGLVSITAGEPGRSVDPEEILKEIKDGIEEGSFNGTVDAPVQLKEYTDIDVEEIAKQIFIAPQEASYSVNGKELSIVPDVDGREVSIEELKKALAGAEQGTTVVVHSVPVKAAVTAEYLQNTLFADRLSGYAVVDGGSWSQINNQTIACEAINGTILLPGDVFSFNDIVGDTTEDKGYVEDYAYENNKLVKQFGGGICRIASTLYAAVLYTNLDVVERYNHTSPVHYLPYGMDATVSYPEPDLKFQNNRKFPIRIEMYMGDDGYVHAGIYGTHEEGEPYVDVELNYITDMLVETYRNYYTEEGGEFLYEVYMHTSSYRDLEPDEMIEPETNVPPAAPATPTTPETPATPDEQTPEVTPAPEPPVPEPTPEPEPEPEPEPPAEEGGSEEGGE